ncbi:phage terminase large subunit, partial [Bradyrhizobium liaoningense]|uniref:phage terminase large subunit n=1 Tax=Bradyrhizobium liaoningense TaxID=43992 RepID=UPI001BA6F189
SQQESSPLSGRKSTQATVRICGASSDADSEAIRERLWEWYLYDFRPRLIPGARQLLIQTRWHEDDLAGRCLNHQPWEVISLPAEAKANDQLGRAPGEFLWGDDAYGYGEQLRELKETTPPRVWSALYQQAPAPDEGDFFKTQWFKPLDIAPSHTLMRCYGASDYAVTDNGGDFTVHVVIGVDHLNNLYLLDIWRGQRTTDVWIDAFCDLVEKYRPLAWAEETGQIKASVGPFLERRMRDRRVWVNREQFPTRGDKAVRARSIQGRLALDGIFYPKNAPWAADFFAEVLNLWVGKHDDQGDALGLVGQLLDKMVKGRVGAAPTVKLPDDGYRSVKRNNNVDAMTL